MDFGFSVSLPNVKFPVEEKEIAGKIEIDAIGTVLNELERYNNEVIEKDSVKSNNPTSVSVINGKHKAVTEERMIQLANYDPYNDPKVIGDVHCTVFIGRLNYKTNESTLNRQFSRFGTIDNIRMVTDKEGKQKGYSFIVFKQAADARRCVVSMNGRMIDGFKIVCDVERGRLIKNWKPRRLGGGVGNGRYHR